MKRNGSGQDDKRDFGQDDKRDFGQDDKDTATALTATRAK